MSRYQCNCGKAFYEPEERSVHMTSCPVMNPLKEAIRLSKEREEKATEGNGYYAFIWEPKWREMVEMIYSYLKFQNPPDPGCSCDPCKEQTALLKGLDRLAKDGLENQ